MDALLAELTRDRWRRTRHAFLAGAAVLAVAGGVIAATRDRSPAAPSLDRCAAGAARAAAVWNPDRRAALERAFAATGRPGAAATASRAATAIDRTIAAWSTEHGAACRDRVGDPLRPNEHSGDPNDRSGTPDGGSKAPSGRPEAPWKRAMLPEEGSVWPKAVTETTLACLDRHLDELDVTIAVLTGDDRGPQDDPHPGSQDDAVAAAIVDGAVVDAAIDLVLVRAAPAACARPVLDGPPFGQRAATRRARRVIAEATVRARVGQRDRAAALADAAEAAAAGLAWRPLVAEVELLHARLLPPDADLDELVDAFERAHRVGMDFGAVEVAVVAALRLSQLQLQRGNLVGARSWADRARQGTALFLERRGHLVPMALHASAHVENQAGDHAAALAFAEQALAAAEALPGNNAAFVARAEDVLGTALDELGRFDDARAHIERGLRLIEEQYGPDTPTVLPMLHQPRDAAPPPRARGRRQDRL